MEESWWREVARSTEGWPLGTSGVSSERVLNAGVARLALIAFRPFWLQPKHASVLEQWLLVHRDTHAITWSVWQGYSGSAVQIEAKARAAVSAGDADVVQELLARLPSTVRVNRADVLFCSPLTVPKPWGKEIWYTGVEARGVCEVVTPNRSRVPLPHLELALGIARPESASALPLVKELDPSPFHFLGELYTELHEQKAEVYVVTAIDRALYPRGAGRVRLGFEAPWGDPEREELRKRLHAYEAARSAVDQALVRQGVAFSGSANAQASADPWIERLSRIRTQIDPALVQEEQRAYAASAKLYRYAELRCGDVVRVPTQTPHALQPGVRVVEFQTPHYERRILSSNQKVLTQEAWDVDAGMSQVDCDTASRPLREMVCSFDNLFDSSGLLCLSRDPVVSFDGLFVRGLAAPGAPLQQTDVRSLGSVRLGPHASVRVCMVTEGSLVCRSGDDEVLIRAGQAFLLPLGGCALSTSDQATAVACGQQPASGQTRALIGARTPF